MSTMRILVDYCQMTPKNSMLHNVLLYLLITSLSLGVEGSA